MDFIDEKLNDYCENHTSQESELLYRITRETNLEVLLPRMLSGHLQGRFLSFLSKMKQPKTILEVGTYTGYSALCLAEGLTEDGKLITLDRNEELLPRVKRYFAESSFSNRLEMRVGDASKIIPELEETFDLVFLDADKKNYCLYLEQILPKMSSGALLIADNVLWSGKVVEEIEEKDRDTPELLKFNKMVQDEPQLENVLLPVRDGLMLARKV